MLGLLVGLIVLCIVLGLVFWLLGMIVGGIPGAPPWIKGAIMALFALIALVWLFSGASPFWGGHEVFRFR